MNYVEPRGARHRVGIANGSEQLTIPLKRNWFVMLFLLLWLWGWALGWLSVARDLSHGFQPFEAAWLCGWTASGVFAIAALAAQFGSERLRVVNRDLEVSTGVGPLRRTRRYRRQAIENLMAWTPEPYIFNAGRGQRPFWMRQRTTGAVKFDYGAKSIYLATGVDEPEGRMIVEWLARRLGIEAIR
jgi:hypothetical protein